MDEKLRTKLESILKALKEDEVNEAKIEEAAKELASTEEQEAETTRKRKVGYHRYFCKEPAEIAEGILRCSMELETLLNKAAVVTYSARSSQFRQGFVEGLLKPILIAVEELEKATNGAKKEA